MTSTLINLSKKASKVIVEKGLESQGADVVLILDISGSMSYQYSSGKIQNAVEKLLALGMNLDEDKKIDIYLFGKNNYHVGHVTEGNYQNYVTNNITSRYTLEGSTYYSGVMQQVINDHTKKKMTKRTKSAFFGMFKSEENVEIYERMKTPVLAIFVTDGDNFDKDSTEEIIKESSKAGIFWQFVGVGSERFDFLKSLDNMEDRFIDNANFFQLNDLDSISDEDLYSRLINEFPQWIEKAKNKGIIG